MGLEERVEHLVRKARASRRRYPRQEEEWELVEMVLGSRLPTDFKILSDHCQELRIGQLEVHIPRLEEVSFPAGSPARLNLRTRLEEEIAGAVDTHTPVEGEVLSEARLRSCLERVGRVALEDEATGERSVFTMVPGRVELVPWGAHPSGAVGYWHAAGVPEAWSVVIAYDGALWREGCSLVDYLLRVIGGVTRPTWLAEDVVPGPADP
jgi:hypothetical protein